MVDQMCYNIHAETKIAQGCFVLANKIRLQANSSALVGKQPCIILRGRNVLPFGLSNRWRRVWCGAVCVQGGLAMSWDKELKFTDGEKTLPLAISSGQFIPWGLDGGGFTDGETVGLFVRDEKTRQLIRDRDPIILEAFARILDEIDEISTVMWFDDLWGEHYDDAILEEKANMVLQSKYSSDWKKHCAKQALAYLEGERRKAIEKKAKRRYSRRRRNQFAGKKDALMLALIERDGYQCRKCSGQEDLSIDHIVPLSKGGSDDLDNLQILCKSCNSSKGDSL